MNKHIAARAHNNPLVGRRVRVIASSRYGGKGLYGCTGTVRAVWDIDSVGVDLDFMVNEGSKHGYFYFNASELEVLIEENTKMATAEEKGEIKMQHTQKLTNYLNVAVIQFLNDPTAFRTIECANYDPLLSVDDLCVVMTKSHGMALAQVVEIKEHPDADLFREVVAGLNTSDYDARVEKRRKAAELKVKMQERAKQLQDVVLYQTLAKEDPEMAAMLQEFRALGN